MGRKVRREIKYETPAEYRMVERAISVQADRKLLASALCLLLFLLYNFKLEGFIENKDILGIISVFIFAAITCVTLVISLMGVHVEIEDAYLITDGVITHKNKSFHSSLSKLS